MMELVRKHEKSKKLYSIAKESRKYMRELNIEEQEERNQDLALTKAGKKNPFMASTHYEPMTLMLTKRKTISGFVARG